MSAQTPNDYPPRDWVALHDAPLLSHTRLQQDRVPLPLPTCASALLTSALGLIRSPAFIVAGQLLISSAAWAFVGVLAYYGQLPLRYSTVDLISRYQSETTYLVTLIAIVISVLSSFFYTKAIERALTSRLRRSLSLGRLRTGIELSRGSFILDLKQPWWSTTTILCMVMLNTLTAAWAALLTPSFIVVGVDLSGQELDLGTLRTVMSNGTFQAQPYPSSTETSPTRWSLGYTLTDSVVITPILSYATSVALGALGVPSMQTVLGIDGVFNISIGGMLPVNLNLTQTGPMADGLSAARVASNVSYPHGLSSNYTILQQGFTADVVCRQQNFSDTGSSFPSMTIFNTTAPLPSLDQSPPYYTSLVSWAWSMNCTAHWSTYMGSVLALNGAEVLLGGVCPFQDFGGPSNQSALVLIRGVNGSYGAYHSLPEVCEVTPFITTIRVQYGGTIVNISDVVNKRPLNTDGSNWPLLVMSAQILAEVFYTSQDMVDNAFMSGIASAMDPAPYSNNFGPVLENYLRGIMEYSGTGVRTSADNEAADIPDEMLIPLNGTMYVTTMGWQYSASIHLSALASMSIIWGLTMYAVAMDYLENRAERKVHNPPEPPVYVAKESFHPSDSLHVILASGSGGLSEALRARSARSPPDYETLRVRLGVQEDGTAVLTTKEFGEDDVDEGNGTSESLEDVSVDE